MKIKGVIENFKMTKILKNLKNDNSKKIYLGLSLVLCGQCWVSSFSDSSLIQLKLLKIYRPLPM